MAEVSTGPWSAVFLSGDIDIFLSYRWCAELDIEVSLGVSEGVNGQGTKGKHVYMTEGIVAAYICNFGGLCGHKG